MIWETAVFYHFIHAVMLFVLAGRKPLAAGPWWCFLTGIVIFSGSLYLLAVTNVHWLGAITPVGGISLLAGWLWLVITAVRGEGLKSAKKSVVVQVAGSNRPQAGISSFDKTTGGQIITPSFMFLVRTTDCRNQVFSSVIESCCCFCEHSPAGL